MDAIASQITSLTTVYSIVYSDADQRKHQSSASLAFVRGIHRGSVNSPHKWSVTRKMFPFDDVIMRTKLTNHSAAASVTWTIYPRYILLFFVDVVDPSYGDYAYPRVAIGLGWVLGICPLLPLPASRWRHNGCDSVSNHQPQDFLLNRLFRGRSKKALKLRVTDLCVPGDFPAQMASNAENVSIWWRHHGCALRASFYRRRVTLNR